MDNVYTVTIVFFRTLDGLEKFTHLEEVVLDNNDLNDEIKFPQLKSLHTVTLNKNKVSFLLAPKVHCFSHRYGR